MKNFWNACPLNLDYFPTKDCTLGEKAANMRIKDDAPCHWYINDKRSNYCFWKWVRSRSNAEGLMPACPQTEISELLQISPNKLNQTYKESIVKLKNSKNLAKLFSEF